MIVIKDIMRFPFEDSYGDILSKETCGGILNDQYTDYENTILAEKNTTLFGFITAGNSPVKDLTYHINRNMLSVMKK